MEFRDADGRRRLLKPMEDRHERDGFSKLSVVSTFQDIGMEKRNNYFTLEEITI